MAGRVAIRIGLTEHERMELVARLRRRKIARAEAMRAEIVLRAAEGVSNKDIAWHHPRHGRDLAQAVCG